jgi:hypothetical protein
MRAVTAAETNPTILEVDILKQSSYSAMPKSAASAARMAVLAAGVSFTWAAQAANCTDAPVSGRSYYIVNKDSGLQLDVSGASQNAGASIIEWPAHTQANQRWTLNELYRGIWTIRAAHSGQAMDLESYNTADSAPVKQYAYSGNPNQQWIVSSSSNGAYTIASNYSKKLLSVADKTAGTAAKQRSDQQGSGLQRWYFNPVDGKCSSPTGGAFGSFMGFNKILVGGDIDEDTVKLLPWDLRYQYIHSNPAPYAQCYEKCWGGCDQGGWWGCWGSSQWDNSSGLTITWNNAHPDNNNPGHPRIQQWTWYSAQDMGITAGNLKKQYSGGDGSPDYKGAINNAALLKGYLDDYRFLLNKIGKTNQNIIHLEPDFWGFLRETGGAHPNDPHYVPAQVRAANPTDCGTEENSAAGLASCMINMARLYATKSTVGVHASCWDWMHADTATEGPKACASYYRELGAGKGDFIVSDAADRDAAWAERNIQGGSYYWWNESVFAQYLYLTKTLTEGVGKPMIIWQIPLGNEWQNNTENNWQDNKVRYMFDRIEDLAKVHVVALQFGAGHWQQTSTRTDDGYLVMKARDYYGKGGVYMK